jgi:hypothetical protein
MFPYERHFHDSPHREPSLKSNAVFPIKRPAYTQGRSKNFLTDTTPVFVIYRLLGQFPLHIKESGNKFIIQTEKEKVIHTAELFVIS